MATTYTPHPTHSSYWAPPPTTEWMLECGGRGALNHSTLVFSPVWRRFGRGLRRNGYQWGYDEMAVTARGALVLDDKYHEHEQVDKALRDTNTVRLALDTVNPDAVAWVKAHHRFDMNAYGVEWGFYGEDGWCAHMPVRLARLLWTAALDGWLLWVGENDRATGTRVKHLWREGWRTVCDPVPATTPVQVA